MFLRNDIDKPIIKNFIPLSFLKLGVCIAETGVIFDFLETVEVELSDEAAHFSMAEEYGQDLPF